MGYGNRGTWVDVAAVAALYVLFLPWVLACVAARSIAGHRTQEDGR
jgi:hypothetical protein